MQQISDILEASVYDTDGADTWIEEGKLLVSVDGGSAYTVFTWKSETNIDNDHTELACEFNRPSWATSAAAWRHSRPPV